MILRTHFQESLQKIRSGSKSPYGPAGSGVREERHRDLAWNWVFGRTQWKGQCENVQQNPEVIQSLQVHGA